MKRFFAGRIAQRGSCELQVPIIVNKKDIEKGYF